MGSVWESLTIKYLYLCIFSVGCSVPPEEGTEYLGVNKPAVGARVVNWGRGRSVGAYHPVWTESLSHPVLSGVVAQWVALHWHHASASIAYVLIEAISQPEPV